MDTLGRTTTAHCTGPYSPSVTIENRHGSHCVSHWLHCFISAGGVGAWFGGSTYHAQSAAFAQHRATSGLPPSSSPAPRISPPPFRLSDNALSHRGSTSSFIKPVKAAGGLPFLMMNCCEKFFKDGNGTPPLHLPPKIPTMEMTRIGQQDQVGTGSGVIMEVEGNTGLS